MTTRLFGTGLIAMVLLAACGGGGGGGGGANVRPSASAGIAQSVVSGVTVTLDGTGSSDSDGSIASYAWTQAGGTTVTLVGPSSSRPSFVAPQVASSTVLTFSLVVTDNQGLASTASTVRITVTPVSGNGTVSGQVRFARVGYLSASPFGLNYAAPTMRSAREVTVQAVDPANPAVPLATTVTDASGNYSLTVAPNISIAIKVVAQMQRGSSQPLPHWDVRVQNGITGNQPYSYTVAAFNSNAITKNIDIPSGIPANGSAPPNVTDRASGPFAILDTIYTAMQKVATVEPGATFPELLVDWGVQTEGTHFVMPSTGTQYIRLLSDLTEDADEFDQHVVAHEFGHYIENNFSRADNVGGSHALGDRLDMRVAFGEGFGYAFAAIVLDDPTVRDGFFDGTAQRAGVFNVDSNPTTTGCWCSESSVFSIIWDLYDSGVDGSDNVTVPFSAIWGVLTGAQRNTTAFTSIFSFITALKGVVPASQAGINALVSAQNINSAGIDAFATAEVNAPYASMLPLYADISRGGGPVTVRSIIGGGHYNRAGNRSFLRFSPTQTGTITISLTTSNTDSTRDPDFIVWNRGNAVRLGWGGSSEYPETETFTVTAGQTYIIDAYDCANGCSDEDGVPGNYNLTVTIN